MGLSMLRNPKGNDQRYSRGWDHPKPAGNRTRAFSIFGEMITDFIRLKYLVGYVVVSVSDLPPGLQPGVLLLTP
jgi:hypothetical protein